jgi:hypothetical protein
MGSFRSKATGSLTALNGAVTAEFRQIENGACGVQVTGTFSATLLIEATMDGTNYTTYAFVNCASGATETSITAVGQFRTELVGVHSVRVRCSAYTSGTAVVTLVSQGN